MTEEQIEKRYVELIKEARQTVLHLKQIENEIITLQGQCSHSKTTWYPDPTGNSGSFEECCYCGKEGKYLCTKK